MAREAMADLAESIRHTWNEVLPRELRDEPDLRAQDRLAWLIAPFENVPWLDPKSAMTQALEKRHAAKFPNDQLDINGGFTFEGLLVAAQAWLTAKSTKADALMDALRKTKIDQHVIIGGPIQFDTKGQNVNIKAAAVENLKRKPTVVMPLEASAGRYGG